MQEQAIVKSFHKGVVTVIGDIMLDEYVLGEVERISPEAPVPVLRVGGEQKVLGAAANVAANIAALGGRARLVGVIGDDLAGRQVVEMLDQSGLIAPCMVVTRTHPTITKTRIMSGQHQIVRVDRETVSAFPDPVVEGLYAEVDAAIEACNVVVLSDYGKGVLSDAIIARAIMAARAMGKPVIVDPKRPNLSAYKGASYITPNRKELSNATGLPCNTDEEAVAAASLGIEQSGAAILLTRSEQGMSLYRHGLDPIHLATEAREVFDVSGAGDTVVATVALSLASGLPIEQALLTANTAAGVVVGKRGTATCSPEELISAMEERARRASEHSALETSQRLDGPTPLQAAVRQRRLWEREGLVVGFANGCFDLLHPGHVSLLAQAAGQCDRLVVALNSDASVRRLKGPQRPVQNEQARATVMNSIKGVDMVVLFDEDTPLEIITALQPDVIIKGADYREDQVVGGDVAKARGGRVFLADLVAGQSTTAMVKRANSGTAS